MTQTPGEPLRVPRERSGTLVTASQGVEHVIDRRPSGRLRHRQSPLRTLLEWVLVAVLAAGVAVSVRHFVVASFQIPSTSMVPTLKVGDRLLVSKLTYQWSDVARGDIIVFKKPKAMEADAGTANVKDLVKRVIGLPGDKLEVRDGVVYVNGTRLAEPYLPEGVTTDNLEVTTVAIDEYFMMGDNREASFDSRYWGTIKRSEIVGKVIFRFWPIRRVGTVH